MKKISIRNLIIVLLCITIVLMAIGFGVLSNELNNLKNKKDSYDVVFKQVEEDTIVKGGTTNPFSENEILEDGHILNMNFNMFNQLDEAAYKVTIKNTGTIDAKIIDIIASPDYINDKNIANTIKPITITMTDITGQILPPGEETTFKVVALYNQTTVKAKKIVPYKLALITAAKN